MKLVVYGPSKRLGCIRDEEIVDLNYAYAGYLKEKGEARPQAKADAEVPSCLLAFIEEGDEGLKAAKKALAYVKKNSCGPRGEELKFKLSEVKLHAPLPSYGTRRVMAGANFYDHSADVSKMSGQNVTIEDLKKQVKEGTYRAWGFWKQARNVVGPDSEVPCPGGRGALPGTEGAAAAQLGPLPGGPRRHRRGGPDPRPPRPRRGPAAPLPAGLPRSGLLHRRHPRPRHAAPARLGAAAGGRGPLSQREGVLQARPARAAPLRRGRGGGRPVPPRPRPLPAPPGGGPGPGVHLPPRRPHPRKRHRGDGDRSPGRGARRPRPLLRRSRALRGGSHYVASGQDHLQSRTSGRSSPVSRVHAPASIRRLETVRHMSPEELDDLPFGVIQLDKQGVVMAYNDSEARLARRTPEEVIGRNFFTEVAPCTNVKECAERFHEGVARGRILETFPFVFTFPNRPVNVMVTIAYDAPDPHAWIFVDQSPVPKGT